MFENYQISPGTFFIFTLLRVQKLCNLELFRSIKYLANWGDYETGYKSEPATRSKFQVHIDEDQLNP